MWVNDSVLFKFNYAMKACWHNYILKVYGKSMLEVIKEKKGTNKTDKSNYKDILNKKGKGR